MEEKSEEISELLRRGCSILGYDVEEEIVASLSGYALELLRWSQRINLVAKNKSVKELVETHFLDSLSILPWLAGPGRTLMDVGTGAGFPGLVCKIAAPDLQVGLVEPRLKRVSFLRHVIRTLGCSHIEVLPHRFEELSDSVQQYNTYTCRAVTEIAEFLRMLQPRLTIGSRIICMKGPRYQDELERAEGIVKKSKLTLHHVDEFSLPFSGAKRSLVIFSRADS